MTTQQYLETLERELHFLRPDERSEVMADYSEHFALAKENGETSEAVMARLGTPQSVAQEYRLLGRVRKAEAKPGLKSVARAVGAVALTSVYNALVLAPLYVAGVLTIVVLYVTAVSVMIAAVAGGVALILGMDTVRYLQASFGFTHLILAATLTAVLAAGAEVFIFTRVFARWFFKGMAVLARKLSGTVSKKNDDKQDDVCSV